MSASTNTVPTQMGFGRLPSAFAALALVVILAVAVAIVALGSTKPRAGSPTSGAKGAPPPAFIDHGWSGVTIPEAIPVVPHVPFNDHGWSTQVYSTETGTGTGGFGGLTARASSRAPSPGAMRPAAPPAVTTARPVAPPEPSWRVAQPARHA